mmetsp:Transcript_30607/g.69698  ORF Transcript_30607/g.69698 Transcript_30607/m.69698 type:complete len:316 (+) Transcript_30607:679-1626(+)
MPPASARPALMIWPPPPPAQTANEPTRPSAPWHSFQRHLPAEPPSRMSSATVLPFSAASPPPRLLRPALPTPPGAALQHSSLLPPPCLPPARMPLASVPPPSTVRLPVRRPPDSAGAPLHAPPATCQAWTASASPRRSPPLHVPPGDPASPRGLPATRSWFRRPPLLSSPPWCRLPRSPRSPRSAQGGRVRPPLALQKGAGKTPPSPLRHAPPPLRVHASSAAPLRPSAKTAFEHSLQLPPRTPAPPAAADVPSASLTTARRTCRRRQLHLPPCAPPLQRASSSRIPPPLASPTSQTRPLPQHSCCAPLHPRAPG